jgi:ribosomal protein S18 acetylase RimI-like enzyme
LKDIIDHGRSIGAKKMYLHVNYNNLPAVDYYKKNGFVATGEETCDIGNGSTVVFHAMEYPL